MNLVLIGMPGAGKSRIGRALAKKAGMKFVDTDKIIRQEYGDIPKVFAEKGEEYFRSLESEAAKKAADGDGRVISTGGGIVLKEENMLVLKSCGTVIYLKTDIDTLVRRTAGSARPLLKGDARKNIEDLLKKRASLYEKYADITVDANSDDVTKKVDLIINAIRRIK
ncbi:MAG: shikimate kinase [Clostridia bacterium]|nr:shikimate kinase [Clostridia bacterium]